MKTRFTTVDIRAVITELRNRFLGMRVANVYDIDNKTYLIKLQQSESKGMILMESGTKLHSTDFEWPKNMMPSGFSMKLRKHIRSRRLESIEQLGIDRIVDLQFGSGEAAYHIILELYDRGNIVLTDFEYTIMNILRPRNDESQDVRFAVREKYPVESVRPPEGLVTSERLMSILLTGKEGDTLKKILIPHLVYGPTVIEHCLLNAGFSANAKLNKDFNPSTDMPQLLLALEEAESILQEVNDKPSKGYIIQKRETKASPSEDGVTEELLTYLEFHPRLFKQHENQPNIEFDSFDKAVDEFFSKLGSQKLDMKIVQQEKQALKKLENVRRDHEKRIAALQTEQDSDNLRAQLIEINLDLVDRAILIVNSALANQVDWQDMENIVKDAQAQGDPVAGAIKTLKLASNHITMLLRDPFDDESDLKPMKIDIDLSLSAYSNARKFYDMKRGAAKKEQKTVEASSKALKSAERKTKETLKEVQTVASINKARKTYWFEKFFWFISSENYLVIGGRDQQQNELIVKRYFTPTDIYVHADLHGASSVIIKNPHKTPVPPKTLNEAGTMAICNSAAWDAKVVTSAWWVTHSQVSKTAPSGEYLTTGSFMIRGKKNYLPPSYLIYGFGILFKLDEDSLERHKDERRVRTGGEDDDVTSVTASDVTSEADEVSSSLVDDTESMLSQDVSDEDSENSENDSERDTDESNSLASTQDKSPLESLNSTHADNKSDIEVKGEHGTDSSLHSLEACDTNSTVNENATIIQGDSVKQEPEDGSDGDVEEALFPDTSLALHHVKGGKFTLQRDERSVSFSSQISEESKQTLDSDEEVQSKEVHRPARLSAKQRRELKKRQKQANGSETKEDALVEMEENTPVENSKPESKEPAQESVPQPKRGQKSKQKKIKEKYKDQDEEERQLRMEILASAGGPKQDKKGKKKNKQQIAQQQQREQRAQQNQHKSARPRAAKQLPPGRLTLQDITVDTTGDTDGNVETISKTEGEIISDDEKEDQLDDENTGENSEVQLLNSLTGQPVQDDILLFAVPVCAPYSVLTNYKFKVKLLPGTTKRGKAAKSALNMFQHDKSTTQREKDLFKSLKDVEFSRNIPGKVKVSAPNLLKSKGK